VLGPECKAIRAAQPTARIFAVEINTQLCELHKAGVASRIGLVHFYGRLNSKLARLCEFCK
jgi:hypothetical protein